MTFRLASEPTIAINVLRSSPQKSLSLSVATRLLGGAAVEAPGTAPELIAPFAPAALLLALFVIEPEVTRISVEPWRFPAR